MKINRSAVLSELRNFVQTDNGVIVGVPGIGKTYILSELVVGLIENEIPACLIHLDALTTGDDADIAALLGMKDANWLDQLAAIPIPDSTKGVIIFDGFDAMRDESLKKRVLRQIAETKKKLSQWSVIASVRTYDALKSPRLIELFPQVASFDNIHCRKYIIQPLTDTELQEFLSTHVRLNELYIIANDHLKQLFRTPFFLSLLNLILNKAPSETTRLSRIKSEIELLDMYWAKVVHRVEPSVLTESFLKGLTERMVKDKQLSVDKYEYLSGLDGRMALIADQLLSENVLSEQGVQAIKIAYAHNILFDYAVSKLIIKDTAAYINRFIQEDVSRVLFLRPSFIYFFTRLWYSDRELFWKIYQELSSMDDNTIRMFNKLVPSAVFVMEFERAEDLPSSEYLVSGNSRIKDILQGTQYLESKADKLQLITMLEKLSTGLQLSFVGEFATVLRKFVDGVDSSNEVAAFKACGIASRNLFDFVTTQRSALEQLIAYFVVPMVAVTYGSDIAQSRQRIEQVLDTMQTPDFNITRISVLLDRLQYIYLADPDLIQNIYMKVFERGELGDEHTIVRTSVVMNLTMSRRDEFNLCRYRLKEFFPTFLRAFPYKAITLSLELVQLFVRNRNIWRAGLSDFAPESGDVDDVEPSKFSFPVEFEINGSQSKYIPDMSHFWSNYSTPDELELLGQVLDYFDELATPDNDQKLSTLLNLFMENAVAGISWKRFLAWSTKHADKLHQQLFQVLLQPAILYWSDTIEEAGGVLEASVTFYSDEQIAQIEKVIHSLTNYVSEEMKDECQRRIVRLLSRIPRERLQLKESNELFTHYAPVENTPVVEFSSYSGIYTGRDFMSDSGIDVDEPVNDGFITIQEELDSFCNEYLNGFPIPLQYAEPLNKSIEVFNSLDAAPELPNKIVEAVLRTVASTCAIVLRSDYYAKKRGEIRDTDYAAIENVVLACLARHSDADTYAEQNYSPASIHSGTPKSEAASSLCYLWDLTGNRDLLPIIEQTTRDRNPIARYGILKVVRLLHQDQNGLFWTIILERLVGETDDFIKGELLSAFYIGQIFQNEQENLLRALSLAQPQVGNLDTRNTFLTNFLQVCLAFYRFTGNEAARVLLQKTLYDHLNIASAFVFYTFEIIQPANLYRRFDDEADIALSQRLMDLLMPLADRCQKNIELSSSDGPMESAAKEAIGILNEIVKRVYYSLQVNDRVFGRSNSSIPLITDDDKIRFYAFVKPLLQKIFDIAERVRFMEPNTAYFFIQILSDSVDIDPEFSLFTVKRINELVAGSSYLYDPHSVSETVKFTERLLADHRDLLNDPEAFAAVTELLNMYAHIGWPEALELLKKMNEIFR